MLYTNLKHIESAADHAKVIHENENTVIVCGNMGPLCVPVYRVAEELENSFKHIAFYDMEYEHPETYVIRNLPELTHSTGLPLVLFYKSGKLRTVISGNQSREQITPLIENMFEAEVKV